MVEMGFETTQPIGMDQMIWHSASVKRGIDFAASTSDCAMPLLVGDMPFGSYEYDDSDIALKNAYRFVKEAGVDAVKLEVSSMDPIDGLLPDDHSNLASFTATSPLTAPLSTNPHREVVLQEHVPPKRLYKEAWPSWVI